MQIRLSPLFAFDWWFKTRTEDEIAHRAERLVRYLEQDFKQVSDDEDEYSDLPFVQQRDAGPAQKTGLIMSQMMQNLRPRASANSDT